MSFRDSALFSSGAFRISPILQSFQVISQYDFDRLVEFYHELNGLIELSLHKIIDEQDLSFANILEIAHSTTRNAL